jgi:hypothetical protein
MDVETTGAAAPSQAAAARRPIGEFLVERGLVTTEQLAAALADQRQSGKRLGEILVERGAITRMALASVLGEQWEEAGRHLRAVVPVRLAGGKEADGGLAGGEELTDSLASLQAAVARLEELSSGPRQAETAAPAAHATGDGLAAVEAALGALLTELEALRETVAAPLVVEGDLADRLGRLDSWLRERDDDAGAHLAQAVESLGARIDALAPQESAVDVVEARLDELAELVARPVAEAPAVDLSPLAARLEELAELVTRPAESGVEERLDRLDAWLRERDGGDAFGASVDRALERLEQHAASADGEVRERLGRLEALLAERRDDVSAELAGRLERLEELLERQPVADTSELAARLDEVRAAMDELRTRPVATVSPEELAGAVRETIEERIGGRDLVWEAAVERLGRLEDSVREALTPRDDERLHGLREAVEELRAHREPAAEPERVAELVGGALAERLDRLEALLRDAVLPRADDRLDDVHARLEALPAQLDDLRGTMTTSHDGELLDRLRAIEDAVQPRTGGAEQTADVVRAAVAEAAGRLEHTLREALPAREDGRHDELLSRLDDLRSAVAAPPDGTLHDRLDALEDAVRARDERLTGGDHAWEAVSERLGGLEGSLQAAFEHRQDDGLESRLQGLEGSLRQAIAAGVAGVAARVDEGFGQLGDRLSSTSDRSGELVGLVRRLGRDAAEANDALAERLTAALGDLPTRAALEASLAELSRLVEQPRDGAVHERLDRIDAALAVPDPSVRTIEELQGRLDSLVAELASANAAALAPVRAGLDALQATAIEPPGARFLERLVARSHNQIAERIDELQHGLAIATPADDGRAIAERDARIADLVEQLRARESSTPDEPAEQRPRPGDTASFLALVPAPDGYRLVALEGTLPAPGEGLAVPEDERRLVVARLGRSPYPGDARPCAYLQAS